MTGAARGDGTLAEFSDGKTTPNINLSSEVARDLSGPPSVLKMADFEGGKDKGIMVAQAAEKPAVDYEKVLHAGIKDKVKSVDIVSDAQLMQKDRHGIVLHPTGLKHPGATYAVLRGENGIPINIIKFVQAGNGPPQYYEQWILEREKNADTGAQKTTIQQYRDAAQTNVGRPPDGGKDVLIGKTVYQSDNVGTIRSATQYNNFGRAILEVDLSGAEPSMKVYDPNSGTLRPSAYQATQLMKMPFSRIYVR